MRDVDLIRGHSDTASHAARDLHTPFVVAALRSDGSVAVWGSSGHGGANGPSGSGFTAVYSTHHAFAALRSDGSVAVWGNSLHGGANGPSGSGFTYVTDWGCQSVPSV